MGENEKNFRGGEPLSEEALQAVTGGTGEDSGVTGDEYARGCHGYMPVLEYMGEPSCSHCENRGDTCARKH